MDYLFAGLKRAPDVSWRHKDCKAQEILKSIENVFRDSEKQTISLSSCFRRLWRKKGNISSDEEKVFEIIRFPWLIIPLKSVLRTNMISSHSLEWKELPLYLRRIEILQYSEYFTERKYILLWPSNILLINYT